MPLISVCIPTHNRAEHLQKCLSQVTKLFRDDCEIVVVDNASTDNTTEIVSRYPQVQYHRNAINIGLDLNVLECLKRATGDYIFLLGDDDCVVPGTYGYLMGIINKYHPSFIYLNYQDVSSSPYLINREAKNNPDQVYYFGSQMMLDRFPHHISAMVYRRREVLKYIGRVGVYTKLNFQRGYMPAMLAYYCLLEGKPPFVYGGRSSLQVRFEFDKPLDFVATYCRDAIAQMYCLCYGEDSLTERQVRTFINRHVLWHTARLIILMKVLKPTEIKGAWKICKWYPLAYFTVLPALLMPKPVAQLILWSRKVRHV